MANRKFIGIELDKVYYQASVERLKEIFTSQDYSIKNFAETAIVGKTTDPYGN